ncbi:MAG: hypothetical protein IT584_01210 [Chlamydiae bacterium]|nr:hypothetical protein [Chlamydiota bacterium]
MKIRIAEKFRPFSHRPGAECLVPGTAWAVRAFPTRLWFLYEDQKIEIVFHIKGPVKEFTLQQDLEKGLVWVFGKALEGYFRLRIQASLSGFEIFAERVFQGGLETSLGTLLAKKSLILKTALSFQPLPTFARERISLGCNKEQNWDAARLRLDLKEMLPPLFLLAQQLPSVQRGSFAFPEEKKRARDILLAFFQAHMTQILVPRVFDDEYQGISFASLDKHLSPIVLLQEAARWIRSLFVQLQASSISILPDLPNLFECGRLLHMRVDSLGEFDLEWSKLLPRKMVFRSNVSQEILLTLPKPIQSFRVRSNRSEKGRYQKTAEPFMVKATATYFLDRFQS